MEPWVLTPNGNVRAVPEDIAATLATEPDYETCIFFFAELAPAAV